MFAQKDISDPGQAIMPLCPRCQKPMQRKSTPGFCQPEKLICSNPTCPSHQPPHSWCN